MKSEVVVLGRLLPVLLACRLCLPWLKYLD